MIKLVQWEDSTVTPTDDRILYDNGYNGVIEGCNITSLGLNLLHISDGYIRLLGGLVEIVGQDIEVETSGGGSKKGQLWVRLDLGSSEPVEFMTEAVTTRSELVKEYDANYKNGVFEFQLATYNINETTVSDLVVTAAKAKTIKEIIDAEVARAKAAEDTINNSLKRLDKAYTLSVTLTANTSKSLLLTLPDGVNSTDYIPIVTTRYASHYNPLNVKVYNVYLNSGKLNITMLSTDTATYTFAVEFKKNGGIIS